MNKYKIPLTAYPEQIRELAVHRYKVIEPYLLHEKTCKHIMEETGLSERTIWYWISQYRMDGLKGRLFVNCWGEISRYKLGKQWLVPLFSL
ncbi:helix-turn-helix domain-containing protein, partial [Listeria weihenstephanensis]